MRLAPLVLLFAVPALLAEPADPKDDKAPVVREIKREGLNLPVRRGRFDDPIKITSPAELAKAIADKDTQGKLNKQIDWKKEYLLLFAWSGSGGDRLTFAVEKGAKPKDSPVVVLTFKAGLTRDLRRHGSLIVIPNKTTYRIVKK
jgi:hypothetical protein